MKFTKRKVAWIFYLLSFAAISLIKFRKSGRQRAEKAENTMHNVIEDIKELFPVLEAANISLDKLTRSEQIDAVEAFDIYSDCIAVINKIEVDFNKHTSKMKDSTKTYFEEWQKEIKKYKNRQIQILSFQRWVELDDIYRLIAQNSIGIYDSLKNYVINASEIQNYLSNDLTPKGIETLAPLSKKVVNDGGELAYLLINLQTAIENTRKEISQTTN
ncbi:MAG: hypothetical protein RO257_08130 [Candidatus Kapabacteria bacterium]|nr:hypothetical protein [Candidatus Kapabacteria bacterium]